MNLPVVVHNCRCPQRRRCPLVGIEDCPDLPGSAEIFPYPLKEHFALRIVLESLLPVFKAQAAAIEEREILFEQILFVMTEAEPLVEQNRNHFEQKGTALSAVNSPTVPSLNTSAHPGRSSTIASHDRFGPSPSEIRKQASRYISSSMNPRATSRGTRGS